MASTLRELRPIYDCNNRPSRSTIQRLVEKFESTGTVQNVAMAVKQRSTRSVGNIAAAEASVEESPKVTRRSQALGTYVMSLCRILRNDLGLHPYKIKLTQERKTPTTRSVVCSYIGLSNNLKMIRIFIEKSSSAMRLISG